MADSDTAAPDLSRMIWFFPEWIAALGPLNESNVLSYFGASPFYDKQSSNEILKMQRMHTGVEHEEGDQEEDLKKFTGAEFALVHARPPGFFIIHKRERFSPTVASPIAAYFIINDQIYQSHDLHALLSSRLSVAVTSIQSSLQLLQSTLTTASPFNPRSESQFVLSKTTAPTLLPPASSSTSNELSQSNAVAVDSPAPGTPSANATQPKRTASTTSQNESTSSSSLSLLLALRTTLTSLPTLLTSSSTAPPLISSTSTSSTHPHGYIGSSLGGRTPGGATPSAGTPSFLNSYTDTRRNTPASVGGGMVPTPPPSSKNRGSPEEGGTGGGGGKKRRKKGGNANATASGSGGGTGGGVGAGGGTSGTPGSQAGTPGS